MITVTEVIEVLHINSSHGADNDYITCIAENSVGKATNEIVLHVNCKYIQRGSAKESFVLEPVVL